MRSAAFLEIALMIFFRAEKVRRWFDLCHNWPPELARFLQVLLRVLRFLFLFRRMIEDYGAVLGADIGPLTIRCRRIVIGPKNVEQITIRNRCRVIFHLDDLGMARPVRANIFVSWILGCSAGITDRGAEDAFQAAEGLFHAPKTPGAKGRFLRSHV